MIELRNIEIGHKSTLFRIENIELYKGKMYVLIGANGAGKTTFLQSVIGLLKTIKGEIKIDNQSVLLLKRIERAKKIAFVNSKFEGIEFLRVREYIALGRAPYTNALGRLSKEDLQVVEETISMLAIDHLANLFTTELSDGERQLAAIARAITQQTDLIILDEPTAFLDYANRQKVMRVMKEISTRLNKCIIVSSHDLELCLESEVDLLVVNKAGKELQHVLSGAIDKESLIKLGF